MPSSIARRFVRSLRPPVPRFDPTVPLQGLTLLAVEDSRFAAEALRLLSHRSGARLRRADSLLAARRHLCTYRPDLVLVDLGLPDGRGEDLIAELSGHAVLATSGDPSRRKTALAAGAAGFLEKPLQNLLHFQRAVLRCLPDRAGLTDYLTGDGIDLVPDPLALHEDMLQASRLRGHADPAYLAGFIGGIARSAGDHALERAANDAASAQGMDHLAEELEARLQSLPRL